MKVTSGILYSYFGLGLLRHTVLVPLALGIALALLFAAGPAAAEGPYDFLVPIVLEEGRTPPKVVDPPGEHNLRQVQGSGVGIRQTSKTLVSNTGQSPDYGDFRSDYAQAFSTGNNNAGYTVYTLTAVQLRLRSGGSQPTYSVYITEDSGGRPGESLGTLDGPTSLTNPWTLYEFSASGNGINLNASTKYWLVIDSSGPNSAAQVRLTTSPNEDAGKSPGWSIANNSRSRDHGTPTWTGGTFPWALIFAVDGYETTHPYRDPITVTYTNADGEEETVENRAASADRDTLWQYFYDSCKLQRSSTTLRDYSWRNADGHLMQAKNGWKYVEVQDDDGNVVRTRPQTETECANHGMYLRQQNCANEDWLSWNPHLHEGTCPGNRTW